MLFFKEMQIATVEDESNTGGCPPGKGRETWNNNSAELAVILTEKITSHKK